MQQIGVSITSFLVLRLLCLVNKFYTFLSNLNQTGIMKTLNELLKPTLPFLFAAAVAFAPACTNQQTRNNDSNTADDIEKAADKTGDDIERAADKTGDDIEKLLTKPEMI
jgi:hypothetical protein